MKTEAANLVDLVRTAEQDQIARRLDELHAEAAALKTLLRALQARDRVRRSSGVEGPRHE